MGDKWKPQDDAADSDIEDEADGSQYYSTKDAILFAIHISPSLLSTHTDDTAESDDDTTTKKKRSTKSKPVSAARTALRCAYEVLQQRIISNPNDMMGILLFGTEETKFLDGNSYKHCYLALDLDVPDTEGIKQLKKLVEGLYPPPPRRGIVS